MFKTLRDALRIEDIRKRLLYVLLIFVIVRLCSQVPVPNVDPEFFKSMFGDSSNDALGFINVFTGGGFSYFSVFALSITPYITASIIVQLLTIAIPKMEEMQRDGADGRKKLTTITRFLTVALCLFEAFAMVIGFRNQGMLDTYTFGTVITVVLCLTAGTTLLMWFGDQINEKGIGNGISMILLINILSRVPQDFVELYENKVAPAGSIAKMTVAWIIIIAVILAVTVLTLILNGAERRIPVQYSQKMVGRRLVGGQSSHIPLKINTAGVIPIIFASSLMSFPGLIAQFLGKNPGGVGGQIMAMLQPSNWFNTSNMLPTLGLLLYVLLVVFFAYFYTSITFNPMEVADNMKKQGGFIPGIRPGRPTQDYLNAVLKYIIFMGATGLVIVCVIPYVFNGLFRANVSFGGTSLIIIVSVILETMKQIESMMLVRNYKGFLNV